MEISFSKVLLILGGAAFLSFLFKRLGKPKSTFLYPPGPKGYPLIGSLFEVPLYRSWLGYDEWLKKYGKILLP